MNRRLFLFVIRPVTRVISETHSSSPAPHLTTVRRRFQRGLFSGPAAGIAIGLNVIIRLLLVLAYRHPPFTSLVLHPFTILYTARIALLSWHGYHNGNIVWKGRSLFNKGKS